MATSTRRQAAEQDKIDRFTTSGEWMTVEQVEDLVQESRSTLDKWRRTGRFPRPLRLPNGSLRYSRSEVGTWLNDLHKKAA